MELRKRSNNVDGPNSSKRNKFHLNISLKILCLFFILTFVFSLIFPLKVNAAEIFSDGFESGNFSSWTSTVTDSGDLSVTAGAALAETNYGLSSLIDDTNAIYGQKNFSSLTTRDLRFRFYLDVNSLTMASGDWFYPIQFKTSASPWWFVGIKLYTNSGNYQIRLTVGNDSGTIFNSAFYTITDEPHYIEVYCDGATTDSSSDGTATLWIDGVQKEQISSLDIYDIFGVTDRLTFGATYYGVDAGTSGTFYLDELVVNDDGSEIGPSVNIDINHENGDLSEYTSTVEDGGDLSVTAGAALAGTGYGLSCLIDDTNAIYGFKDVTASTSGVVRSRFYFDPNGLTMANNTNHTIAILYGNPSNQTIALLYTGKNGSGNYYIYVAAVKDDATWASSSQYEISDNSHYIEIKLIRATSDVSSDGSIQLWIDGADKETVSGFDNYDRFASFRRFILGPVSGLDDTTSGTFYLDELVVRNYDSEIGAFSDTTAPSGGSITYTDGVYSGNSVSLTVADGTDSQSSIDTTSRIVQRKQASYSGGTCGSYGSFSTITTSGTYPDFTDITVSSGNCYQYRYLVSDNSGNQATYTSANTAKFEAAAPVTTSFSSPGAPVCGDSPPGTKTPSLYKATPKSTTSILLEFTKADDPVSEYVLEYGTATGDYKYSMANIGGKDTTSYLVQSLSPNTYYFFRVRASNGCATGKWSNEIQSKTLSSSSFNTDKDKLETEIIETEVKEREVVEEGVEEEKKEEEKQQQVLGVDVKIKVVDEQKQPLEGVKVTLHSTPREETTNKDGIAFFEDVEPGEHKAVIAYNNQTGEQTINVSNDPSVSEVDFTIQLKQTPPFRDFKVIAVIASLVLAIIALLIVVIRSRRKAIR